MPINFTGSYSQNFDTLATSGTSNSWSNDTTLPGWFLFRQPTPGTAITTYLAGSGTNSAGSFYSFGSTNSTDRALGGVGSGSADFGSPASGAVAGWIAFAATNTIGATINNLTVAFNGEQWRDGGNTTAQSMVLEYGFGTSFGAVSTWIAPSGNFNWTSPVATTTSAAVNGNVAGRVANRGGTLNNLNWANNDTLWIRWIERNDTGNDHGLAIDDFSIAATTAPTIALNLNTTNFLDGGIATSPATPFVISGVINDPTDPASTLGINFTLADSDTPVNNLTVTATSSNLSVVPNANLVLTGTGTDRNLKITPAAVGYSDITLTVSDGTNSANYVLRYAASATSGQPSTTRFHTGASDASTAVAIDSNYMLVADDEDQKIRLYDRNNSGLPLNSFDFTSSLGLTDISNDIPREVDIEASTRVGNRIYWLGSLSNSSNGDPRPNRDRLFATDISGTGANTTLNYVGQYDNLRADLIAWGDANGYGFSNSAATGVNPEASDGSGFNIEGLTIAPNNTTAYVAFRAPNVPTLSRQKALIAPIINFTELVTGAAINVMIGTPIELDLGGRGIREIQRTSNNQYLIIAGPPDTATGTAPRDFRLYTWTGNANDAPILNSADLTSLNAGGSFESILEFSSNASSAAFLGQQIFNTNFIPSGAAGTVNGQQVALGGLSGVTYDPVNNRYYAISDDRSFFAPARFYTFTTDPSTIATTGVNFTNVTPLKDPNGNFFATNTVDTEGIAFTNNGTVFISSEGEANPNVGRVTNPFIKEFNLTTGVEVRSLPIPAKFLPVVQDTNNNGVIDIGDTQISGVRDNLSLESLTISPDRTKLYTATESALLQDGPTATTSAGSRNRILQYNLATGQPQAEYLYNTDASPTGSIENGLPDLLAIDNQGTLLALERSLSTIGGFTIKIYEVSLQGATDISAIDSLNSLSAAQLNAIVPAQKRLLLNLNSLNLPADFFHPTGLDNIEGLALGPQLPDGRRAIVLVSDNNFQQLQYTQILSLAYDPQSIDNRIQLLVDNGDTIFYNDGTIAKDLTQDNWQKFRSEIITLGVPAITKINQIQGSGATFNPAFGGTQIIEGIVTRSFPGATKLNGFYVQEEDIDADADPTTSEAIFVYDPNGLFTGNIGDKVRITGTVSEFTSNNSSLTQLSNLTNVTNLGASTLPTVTNIQFPVTNLSDLERYEGMLVNISAATGNLTVTDNLQLGRFGQIVLAATGASNQSETDARLDQYTQFNNPSISGYAAYQAEIAKRRIYLDDGSTSQNLDPILFGRNGNPLSASNTLRSGDTVANITGILDERFEGYRIQTSTPVNFTSANPRLIAPPAVGGSLKVGSFNVLNYFNGDGAGGGFPTARGAENLTEFNRQRDKLIQAIISSGADVLGLMELENDGYDPNSAIQDLVNGLNAVAGAGTYTFINPGTSLATDQITVGLIYKSGQVTPVGAAATMPNNYGTGAFDLTGRKPLAQTFQQTSTGGQFTVVVNHFKSKGSNAGGVGDADIGDGQGLSNGTRTRQAQDLSAWLATNPTGTTDPDYLIIGDLNAYAKEDPITTLANAGYNSLLPITSYSYIFDGQVGSLDHALANSSLATQVTGAGKWHINADEPNILDYNTNFRSAGQITSLYNADPYRSSDHDPVIVGLNLTVPVVSIEAIDANASEAGNDPGTFRISRTGGGLSGALNVSYTVAGQASANDYTPTLTGVATIAANQSFVDITVTPVDDNLVEGNETLIVSLVDAIDYDLSANNSATITIADNDTAGVIISQSNTNVTEGGATDNYTVVLATQPTAPVTVNVTPSNNQINLGAGAGTAISLNFTPNTWNTPQTVTVTAVDDPQVEGNHSSSISHSSTSNDSNYNLNLANVAVNITDNDSEPLNLSLAIAPNTFSEGAGANAATATITRTGSTAAQLIVNLTSSDTTEVTVPNSVIIPVGQTSSNFAISAVEDSMIDGSQTAIITASATGFTNANANVTVTDNDVAGVIISQSNTNVTEGGATDNYTVVLATQPTAPVTVNVTPSNNQINLGAGAGTAISLNFTPNTWNTPQTVTVTAVDDPQVEGNHSSSISHSSTSNDSNYNLNLANVAVNITDNDTEQTPTPTPTPTPQPYNCGCDRLENLVNNSHNGKLPNSNPPDDLIIGSDNFDILFGGIGNDSIFGRSGDDLIFGNQDRDFINGNKGNDTIFGGKDNDLVRGGQDNDLVFGDLGNDTLSGDRGNDTVYGGIGDDVLVGFEGEDFLNGNQGKDTLSGGEGNDILRGGQDDDKLCGNAGNDTLYGDLGNDTICGCEGDDLIFGGAGNDTIAGGAGSDIFVLTSGAGNDVVLDFAVAQDKLGLTNGLTFQSLTITQGTGAQTNDTLIRIAATGELLASLVGVSASAIGSNLFTTV